MSEWKKVKLGEVTEYITDGDHQPAPKSEQGVYFIKIKDIINNRISFDNALHVPSEYYAKLKNNRKAVKGDVLYTVVGSYGTATYVNTELPFCFERNIALLHANQEIDSYFLYLLMSCESFYKKADALANGAAQKLISLKKLQTIEIEIPSLTTQHRIATILSRYDSLIENYQKQIKLLEEAAQRLYKEWFVNLRFPGHESTNIVDGVPEGWEKKKVGEIAEFKRGKTITKKDVVEGNVPVVAGGLEPAYFCNKSNTTNRVITVSGSGANAGFTRLYFEKVWASDCSFADTNTTKWLHFVYCFLQSNKSAIDNMQKGAAQPHVYAKDINALDIMVPEAGLLSRFEDFASTYFNKVQSLQSQLRLLTEARDRLLPKLMGGEIEV